MNSEKFNIEQFVFYLIKASKMYRDTWVQGRRTHVEWYNGTVRNIGIAKRHNYTLTCFPFLIRHDCWPMFSKCDAFWAALREAMQASRRLVNFLTGPSCCLAAIADSRAM